MRYLYLFCVGLFVISGLSSCERCGPDGEPSLTILITRPPSAPVNRVVFSEISSLNGALNRSNVPADSLISLPLSLNADSTTYVFVQASRTDTLTVRYQRTFSYQSTKCGYVLDLAAPARKNILRTTFPQASASLNYEGGGIFKSPGPDVTGITVYLQP